jgi:sugar phosphate isomerase/epimerase
MAFGRAHHMGLEVFKYAAPAFVDAFEANHRQVAGWLDGVTGRAMHGAYVDTFYTSKDPLICEVVRRRFVQSVNVAAFHGIGRVVFHSGYRKFFDGASAQAGEDFINTATDFWQRFEENIPQGVTVFIENVEDERPEILTELIRRIDSPKIGCCFDIGHAHCNSNVPVGEWAMVLGSHIGHVHIHDNHGDKDAHLPLGKGNAPLADVIEKVLSAAGEAVPFVVECSLPESEKWLKEAGFMP